MQKDLKLLKSQINTLTGRILYFANFLTTIITYISFYTFIVYLMQSTALILIDGINSSCRDLKNRFARYLNNAYDNFTPTCSTIQGKPVYSHGPLAPI